ncbi:OPT oligopeptide transporter protein-domain-containing protein [Thamnocephalis sphaerospora]|uniref:OPT oligopeptide transporter protein-domain-containing protein n=1 Tax=Thamnocephalis sphaerospora TaxID=78915 RepID=A0A4P9XJX8_9FUNG|nr:OPT oligopeptide transporter protein-domain-containing protein [Thamnocephalis sphaerospora]|eukprot:RKP05691.1 OPT oligopeptide transporter protein-domain-containing protein [Thamnocephalis sphaerospora]
MEELRLQHEEASVALTKRRGSEQLHGNDEDDSPFEIVRATVSNCDDPTLPTMTFRFWTLSMLFTVILSFVNQFFWFRETPLVVGILVVQLLTYPLGRGMARFLPTRVVKLGGFQFSLNPGPFNIKEHVLITACANASAGTAYAIDIVTIKRLFYKQDLGFVQSMVLVITTQCLGYGLAGMCRRFLIRPAAMIWPANLVNIALFRTLHEDEDTRSRAAKIGPRSGPTRIRFFIAAASCSFVYYFLPGFLAPFLTTVSLLCYIFPRNRVMNLIGSGSRGLGVLSFTLDWNTVVSFLLSPLITPFWAECNIMLGFVLVTWCLIPVGYFSDIWNAQTFPILSSRLFTSNGSRYSTLELLGPDLALNEAVYRSYGPPRLSYFFAITYGVGFATLAAVIVHTALYHGPDIIRRFRESRSATDDIHARLMDRYPEVPDLWYFGVFLVNLVLSILACELFGLDLPWWALLLAVCIAAIFILPIGIITAIANQTPGLNIITEFIIGFILPGRPIANVTFKTYGYISMAQGITFLSDLKLGHYMKIPPHHMFLAQLVGTVIAGFVNLSTAYLMFHLVPNLCQEGERVWACSNANVFFSASVIWGVIGPNRMFGTEGYYSSLMWWFLVGALLPVPAWLLARRYPRSWLQYVHVPVILGATAIMPPAQPVMYPTWFLLGFIFQFVIYRYHRHWWSRYNYVLSAALDAGVATAGIIIFFAFQYRQIELSWWGTQTDCPNFNVL